MFLSKVGSMLLIFLASFILKRRGVFEESDSGFVGDLLVYIVVPAVIVDSFSGVEISADLAFLPLSALIVVSGLLASGFVLSRYLNWSEPELDAFRVTLPTLEGGTIGYSFMLAAFGEEGLSKIVLFDFMNAVFLFTVVYYVSGRLGENSHSLKKSVLKIFKSPLIWAIPLGFILNLTGFENALLSELLSMTGDALLFLVMVLLGLSIDIEKFSIKFPAKVLSIKAVIGLSLGLICVEIFGLTGLSRKAVILGSLLPPTILAVVFAKENNLDTERVSEIVTTGLIISIIVLPLITSII